MLTLIGLLLLGLSIFCLWRGCNDNKATAPAENATTGQVAPVPTDDANKDFSSFNITTGEGDEVYGCGGEVGDQALKNNILDAFASVFGTSEKCDNIQIDNDNAMTFASQENLEATLTQIKAVPNAALSIKGNTDSSGNEGQNVTLSQERADAVKEYLVEQGVPSTALTSTGAGSSQPVADNATDQGKFRNRRISFSAP